MRMRILGSGTLLPHAERGSPAHWLQVGDALMLVDSGSGTLGSLARFGLPWERITHVLLTHFHTDHVGDLAPLLFALKHRADRGAHEPLQLLGPVGLAQHLQALASAHGTFVLDPGFPIQVRELSPGEVDSPAHGPWTLSTRSTRHTKDSLAYRIDAPRGSVGFTGDTGPSPGLGSFFQGCQVLVAECSNADGSEMDTHLTPRSLALLAREAAPDLLVTVHVYPPLDPERIPRLLAEAGYSGQALPGRDGLGIDWVGGRIRVRES